MSSTFVCLADTGAASLKLDSHNCTLWPAHRLLTVQKYCNALQGALKGRLAGSNIEVGSCNSQGRITSTAGSGMG